MSASIKFAAAAGIPLEGQLAIFTAHLATTPPRLPGNAMAVPTELVLSTQNLNLQLQWQLRPGPITGHHLQA